MIFISLVYFALEITAFYFLIPGSIYLPMIHSTSISEEDFTRIMDIVQKIEKDNIDLNNILSF